MLALLQHHHDVAYVLKGVCCPAGSGKVHDTVVNCLGLRVVISKRVSKFGGCCLCEFITTSCDDAEHLNE